MKRVCVSVYGGGCGNTSAALYQAAGDLTSDPAAQRTSRGASSAPQKGVLLLTGVHKDALLGPRELSCPPSKPSRPSPDFTSLPSSCTLGIDLHSVFFEALFTSVLEGSREGVGRGLNHWYRLP